MKIGPYHLISKIGSGGMAQVWLAHKVWEDGTRRSVVFKFTRRKGAADEATLRQLVEEGRLSILLSHNNIVSTIDVGVHERVPYLVMEYVPGRDLAQLLLATARTEGAWDVETAVHVMREVAQGLKYAHELERDGVHQQIIHRDVSSKNVMIDGSGGVRLMDFGVATSLATRTSKIHLKGTLQYMAPEHYLGRPSAASDVFGLGVIFWEMLSGRICREGLEKEALISEVVSGAVGSLGRQLPAQIQRVLDGMLEPNAAKRITVRKLLHAIKDFPSRRMELEDMLSMFFGRIGKRTGLSQVHFAACKELSDTFAVAKAAGVSLDEPKPPGQPGRIPADFIASAARDTSRVDPLAVGDALDDDEEEDEEVSAVAGGIVRGTVRLSAAGPDDGVKLAATVRLPASVVASPTAVEVRAADAPSSPTVLVPQPVSEPSEEPRRSWPSSAPPVATVRASRPDTSGVASRRRVMLWVATMAVTMAIAIAVGLGVASWLIGSPQETREVPDLEEAVAVSSISPSTGTAHAVVETEVEIGEIGEVATTGSPLLFEEPGPEPGPEPAPEVRVEPSSTPSAAAPKPKRRVPKLEFVVRRGLAVEFAELRVGRGKVHQVPERGALALRLSPGIHTLRYRSEREGPWQSKRQKFLSGMKYAGNVERSGLRITRAPKETRSP